MAISTVHLVAALASAVAAMPAIRTAECIYGASLSQAPFPLPSTAFGTGLPVMRRSWASQAWSSAAPSQAWSGIGISSAVSRSWAPQASSSPRSTWAPQSTWVSYSVPMPQSTWAPAYSQSAAQSENPPAPSAPPGGKGDTYTFYQGDGSTEQGWPDQTSWVDFDTMWNDNQVLIQNSCTQFGQANPSSQEISDVYTAISAVSGESGVDPRFILAVVMQESKGCVRAPTTNYGVRNPGLMQDYNGAGTCNENGIQDPCPSSEIMQMIRDGTEGTADGGPGLVQDLAAANALDVSEYYKAARIYNSGSIDVSGDLGAGIATHCYSSDIANRLTGWVEASSTCPLDG